MAPHTPMSRTPMSRTRMSRTRIAALGVALATALVLAACGTSTSSSDPASAAPPQATDAPTPSVATPGSTPVPGSVPSVAPAAPAAGDLGAGDLGAGDLSAGDPAEGDLGAADPSTPGAGAGAVPDDGRGPRELRTPCRTQLVAQLPAGFTCRTLVVDGYPREYLAYVPASVAATPAPAVLMFHGSTGTMEQFAKISGWREKADAEGFVVGFTQGLQYFVTEDGTGRWSTKFDNYGLAADIDLNRRLPGYPAAAPWPADDVAYTSAVLDDLATLHPIDPGRTFVSGFSNGSSMANRLAVELDDRITAATGSGGFLGRPLPADVGSRATEVAPLWVSLGTKDDKFLAATGESELPLDPAGIMADPALSAQIHSMLTLWNLPEQPCSVDTTATTTTFRWCAPGQPDYRFTMIKDMTHTYPHRRDKTSNPYGVDMVGPFWDFMQQNAGA